MSYSFKQIIFNEIDKLLYRENTGETTEIHEINVESKRRSGIGSKLIIELTKRTNDNIFAFCHCQNEVAQKFYEKNGFVGTRIKNFYKVYEPYTSGDAILYVKENKKD
jgi:ribosomal protein S18 acetylase RimI-like enzyme